MYSEVLQSIKSAMKDIDALNVDHKEGKREISIIKEKLKDIESRFDSELNQLKEHAEWDIFTLAFFGETNAGKSTIIESLRILFKEESRQALLQQHADDLEQFSQALTVHIKNVREGLQTLYSEYTGELATISQSTARLTQIVQHEAQQLIAIAQAESDARTQLAQQEVQARLEAHQQESSARLAQEQQELQARLEVHQQESVARLAQEQQEGLLRLQIAEMHAASRFKLRLTVFSISGVFVGSAVTVVLLKLIGI